MNSEKRLPSRPSRVINRKEIVTFAYNGKMVECYEGDTVSSALCARGQTILARSFNYHRPRGLLCVSGHCPNCFMNIDSKPNVKACTTLVVEGMNVNERNPSPSLQHDANPVVDRFSFLLPIAFYYKSMIRNGCAQ